LVKLMTLFLCLVRGPVRRARLLIRKKISFLAAILIVQGVSILLVVLQKEVCFALSVLRAKNSRVSFDGGRKCPSFSF